MYMSIYVYVQEQINELIYYRIHLECVFTYIFQVCISI